MTPASKPGRFLSLSNELLRKVVKNLHAPAAVCLALTCKHLMTVVTSVCDCSLNSIVRRYRGDVLCYDWDNALQDYSPTAADIALYENVGSAWKGLRKRAYETVSGLKIGYTLEYIGLMKLLDYPKMYPHAQKGHARYLPLGESECSMCAILVARCVWRSWVKELLRARRQQIRDSGTAGSDDHGKEQIPDGNENEAPGSTYCTDDNNNDSKDNDHGSEDLGAQNQHPNELHVQPKALW